MNHLMDNREGRAGQRARCADYPSDDARMVPLVGSIAETTCPNCLRLVQQHRRLTAATATRGLALSPDAAMPLWQLGMTSSDLRAAVLGANTASYQPPPDTDIPYEDDGPWTDQPF